jgi:hypothetical protein
MSAAALALLARDGVCRWPEPFDATALEALLGPSPERRPVPLAPLAAWLGGTCLPALLTELLGPGARPVRALLMGKGGEENWAIPFHQDTTLALKEYREVPGFDGWANKAHFYHAQAPAEVMEAVLSTRLHLDDCGPDNGPLKVIPGSHTGGKLDAAAIAQRTREPALTFAALRGEVVLMKPLVLHGSDRAESTTPRRVLHIEWAAVALPGGLEWAWF